MKFLENHADLLKQLAAHKTILVVFADPHMHTPS